MARLRVGVALPTSGDIDSFQRSGIAGLIRHAEQLGFESVWVADVMTGDGTPSLEPVVTLAAAASVTDGMRLGFSVLALPARSVAWTAAQIQALQHLSGNRLLLGVGAGGFPGTPFWQAVGAPSRNRGRWLDAALAVLPELVAGKPTRLDDVPGQPIVTLAPAAPVPPILIGSFRDSDASIAARFGDGWFPSLLTPPGLARAVARLRDAVAEHARDIATITVGIHAILGDDDAARSARDELIQSVHDDHGISWDEAATIPIMGSRQRVAEHLAAYAAAGADRLVLAPASGDWFRQTELLAHALHEL